MLKKVRSKSQNHNCITGLNFIPYKGYCSQCLHQCSWLEQQQEVVLAEAHKQETDLHQKMVFGLARLSIVKDQLSWRQPVVGMLVEEEDLDRTRVVA